MVLGLLAVCAPASANATTILVASGTRNKTMPCTAATPCDFVWAIKEAAGGDTVQFESGAYEFVPKSNADLTVADGVTIEPAPGDASRPQIVQSTAYTSSKFNLPTLALEPGASLVGLEVDQAAATPGNDGGRSAWPLTRSSNERC